jgi:hypothetical protein
VEDLSTRITAGEFILKSAQEHTVSQYNDDKMRGILYYNYSNLAELTESSQLQDEIQKREIIPILEKTCKMCQKCLNEDCEAIKRIESHWFAKI